MMSDADLAQFLASWIPRYPFSQGWVDDRANSECRRCEASWFSHVRGQLNPLRIEELVVWRFHEPRQRLKPLEAVSTTNWPKTMALIEKARAEFESGSDDLVPLQTLDDVFGWGVPMASALLFAWNPERVILADARIRLVLHRLGLTKSVGDRIFTQAEWVPYLTACRKVLAICNASSVKPDQDDRWTFLHLSHALLAAHDTVKNIGVFSAEPVNW